MEAYIRIFENGNPLSVDELRGYEVCSIVDEIVDHLLNSRKNPYYYDVHYVVQFLIIESAK
jgi:hypothetical protein